MESGQADQQATAPVRRLSQHRAVDSDEVFVSPGLAWRWSAVLSLDEWQVRWHIMSHQVKPRRIIRAALFDEPIGAITADELLAMPEDRWGNLRDRLTDGRHGRPGGLSAACLYCGHPVYIQVRNLLGIRRPGFAHFGGGDPRCAWHYGSAISEDAARAAQYHGQQEGELHRRLCEQIAALATLDERHVRTTVAQYLPPKESEFGRYPDVYVEWEGFRPFAIEFQLSNTFQTEISARCSHYDREGVPLLWVLYGVDPDNEHTPQSYRDVMRRHRNNAFVLDRAAIEASHDSKTLVLASYLQNEGGGFDPPRLIRVDALNFPERGLPYVEDRITAALNAEIGARRRPWFDALKGLNSPWDSRVFQAHGVVNVLAQARERLGGGLSIWEPNTQAEDFAVLRLVAIVFSVAAEAVGRPHNYATRHPNIRAMLNTLLNNVGSEVQRYALLLETLLAHTTCAPLLKGTVGQHIERAKQQMEGNLCLDGEPEWDIVRYLLPEVFDPVIRQEMKYLGVLPSWATAIAAPLSDEGDTRPTFN